MAPEPDQAPASGVLPAWLGLRPEDEELPPMDGGAKGLNRTVPGCGSR
jgi:hypothetical protein